MTHLELENLISEYLEGQLDTARRVEVEAHLEGCAPCAELVKDVRHALEMCQSSEEMEPAPWLVPKILLATIGERKPTLLEMLAAYFKPAARMKLAYGVAMAVFSFSIIVNTAGINLRHLTLADLNPHNWFKEGNRTVHLLAGRAEKFYYDLRVVYELESFVRQFRQQTGQGTGQKENESTKPETPTGGTTDSKPPGNPELAEALGLNVGHPDLSGRVSYWVGATRSSLR